MFAFLAFAIVCCVLGFLAVKAFEWRQDVLYGPYMKDDKRRHLISRKRR
jgi:hypothetical protein